MSTTLSPTPAHLPVTEIGPPPWPPRLRRFAIAMIGLLSALSMTGLALSPYLLVHHPLLLVALSPEMRHVALAAGRVDPALLFVVAVLRRTAAMTTTYAVGAIWGFAMVRWAGRRSPRAAAWISIVERLFSRWGTVLLALVPSYSLALLAGAARMPARVFFPAIVLCQAIGTALGMFAGEALSKWVQVLLDFLARYMVESTLVAVLLVVVQQIVARRKRVNELRED